MACNPHTCNFTDSNTKKDFTKVSPDGGRVKLISVMNSKLLASFDGFERGHALDITESRVLKIVHLTVGSKRMLNLKIVYHCLITLVT